MTANTTDVNILVQEEHLAANGLHSLVTHSFHEHDVSDGIHATVHMLSSKVDSGLKKAVPGLERLTVDHHAGNYVVVRETGERIFEAMPMYVRIGMHMLFHGKEQMKLLETRRMENILREQSIRQGKHYDSHESVKNIPSFVAAYKIQLGELLEPDLSKYPNFNEFFYRKLKPGARPVHDDEDPLVICSPADCRLAVYPTMDLAKKFWVKGRHFDIPNLLGLNPADELVQQFSNASLAIARLAPADYHRFHSPIDGTLGEIVNIPGQYYTVNPLAVNEVGFDVFTANTRSILYIKHKATGLPVAFVAIGALLVGSIKWTKGAEKGSEIKRGDEVGYFAYGGSTIVVVMPPGVVQLDQDLVVNSQLPMETIVKVGSHIGKTPQ
ncbi:hypothetical protein BDN72DRAFT_895722 [Pluteus cervinus]|uniref:Uncharacterized protein n=1 Tax=Pluteus cervinus TaxID=181527 RepID=A0ACD3B062_9AGAR|nr:hypothetical protein BDN72DRAFT_895722 [Pluteus cervinus]